MLNSIIFQYLIRNSLTQHNKRVIYLRPLDGFGGLVVSILTTGTRVQTRPKPLDFSGVQKILSMSSIGGEVK